ncbi:MAG: pseudouridine-5'-phosphate glycosidase [Anaerolineae bacterium]|nr:MAG: pseudouridine-5'-phosphate glycosidase [Anaerolineae bacterium]
MPNTFIIEPVVARALQDGQPVVALESTVITHGLPKPQNLQLASDLEAEVRAEHAVPATIGVLDGRVRIGMKPAHLERLAGPAEPPNRKISSRDLGPAIALRQSGGTTVAGTLAVAVQAGIQVFATGGIGGVHRDSAFDISADLPELARCPMVVVCAGAKAILDLPATLEYLETAGVPVVGYQTNEFPAFYSRESGLPVTQTADSPKQIADIAKAHWGLGLKSAVLVVNPPPEDAALPFELVESYIEIALAQAEAAGIYGQEVTPFLLDIVSKLSGGESLKSNLALLKNNARLAARVAGVMASRSGEILA